MDRCLKQEGQRLEEIKNQRRKDEEERIAGKQLRKAAAVSVLGKRAATFDKHDKDHIINYGKKGASSFP